MLQQRVKMETLERVNEEDKDQLVRQEEDKDRCRQFSVVRLRAIRGVYYFTGFFPPLFLNYSV